MSLTALRDDREIIRRHFLESIQAGALIGDAGTLLDLGSGNGFPGTPLKLLHPRIRLMAIDSNARKCAFLRELFRTLGWPVADVLQRRVESGRDLRDLCLFRSITVRGVRLGPGLVRGLLDRLEEKGRLILFTTDEELGNIREASGPDRSLERIPLPGRSRSCLAVIGDPDVPRGTSGTLPDPGAGG